VSFWKDLLLLPYYIAQERSKGIKNIIRPKSFNNENETIDFKNKEELIKSILRDAEQTLENALDKRKSKD
jgi:hypothetical protein